jgi:uncharacterized protein YjbJ (UPF0337 family)
MRAAWSLFVVVMLALALGACGESEEEKALNTVCDAKDDIATQVDELEGLTAATVTTDAVRQNLEAIRDDLGEIADAQGDLSDDRRSEVEAATNEFTSSIRQVAGDVGSSLSASEAKDAVVTALERLGASYQETLAPIDRQ